MDQKLSFKTRKSRSEIEDRGIVPRGYFNDPIGAIHQTFLNKEKKVSSLSQRFDTRPQPQIITSNKIYRPSQTFQQQPTKQQQLHLTSFNRSTPYNNNNNNNNNQNMNVCLFFFCLVFFILYFYFYFCV